MRTMPGCSSVGIAAMELMLRLCDNRCLLPLYRGDLRTSPPDELPPSGTKGYVRGQSAKNGKGALEASGIFLQHLPVSLSLARIDIKQSSPRLSCNNAKDQRPPPRYRLSRWIPPRDNQEQPGLRVRALSSTLTIRGEHPSDQLCFSFLFLSSVSPLQIQHQRHIPAGLASRQAQGARGKAHQGLARRLGHYHRHCVAARNHRQHSLLGPPGLHSGDPRGYSEARRCGAVNHLPSHIGASL